MRRLSIARTLQVALLGLTFLLSTIAGLGVAALYDTRQEYEERLAESLELQASAARLLAAAVVEEATLRTATGERGEEQRRRARAAFRASLADARARASGDPVSEQLVAEVATAQRRLREEGAGTSVALAAREPIADLAQRQGERLEQARDAAQDDSREALLAIVVSGGLALLAVSGLVTVLLGAVRRPLDNLVRASGRLAGGRLDTRVPSEGPGELQEVARSFNAMAADLDRARSRLEAERRRLDTTVRSLGDGLMIVAGDGRIAMTNPRAAELVPGLRTGARPQDAGLELPEPAHARSGEVLVQHEHRTLAVTAAKLEEGEPGTVWTLRDATERARLERLKSEFVATASHELRSPLTSIKGFVELLAAEPNLQGRHREFIEIIHLSTNRLVDLVNDLLDVARLEAGFVEVHRRPTDLADVVREVAAMLQPRVDAKDQQLDLALQPGTPRALADASRMRQVLMNLLTNAHLYTPEGGRLEVALRDAADGVVLEVADTGRGMEPAELEHVFDRFHRGAESSAGTPGTGLGLAIVRSLVDLHQGHIEVESTPGEGTVFRVTLPRAPVAGQSEAVREALRGRRVLVLDDEPEIARLIARRLEPYGVEAHVALDGDEALERLRSEEFDALTVDILMPGMSGFDVLRVLRSDPELAGIPAVVVSVFSGREALSGEWVVSKPIDPEELADALGAAVLAGRVRVLACSRPEVRASLSDTLNRLGIVHEWASGPGEVERLCGRHRFEVALVDAGLPEAPAVLEAVDLRGRRLRRSVVLFSADEEHPGFARLDADPIPLADAGVTVLGLLGPDAAPTG